MYDFIKGTLYRIEPGSAVIETASGIGYLVFTPLSLFFAAPKVNYPIHLYLCAVYREDSQKLFGFITSEERDLFEKITAISGIGPKTALSLIGHLSLDALGSAIQTSNVKLIEKVPGIGKKTAERLVMEMRDKIHGRSQKIHSPLNLSDDAPFRSDAISALLNLGYTNERATKAIERAIDSCGKSARLDEVIKSALQTIQK